MDLLSLFLLAVGLSMDAFAVAVCKGLEQEHFSWKNAAVVGIWFGFFQALMPVIGYFCGSLFVHYIEKFDHWIAFFLLALIGGNMIRESFGREEKVRTGFRAAEMLLLAIATSIDALAVGITFAFLSISLPFAVLFIGVCTFMISAFGVFIGSRFGEKYRSFSELLGGIILIGIGIKILLEHLGVF
ncbi:MAG: manganese efflux pump MntP family protein [Lachnospiraceae bacterium]|nr:manganese efflux pump MntP family protein [Lachnospiraceae bacterium]